MHSGEESSGTLPGDVMAAVQRGNKIEAIKRLRETRNISLKDAKEAVERYVRGDPLLVRQYAERAAQTTRVVRFLIAAAVVLLIAYILLQA